MSSPKNIKSNNNTEKILSKSIDVAEQFNEYFTTIGPNLAAKIISNNDFEHYLNDSNPASFFFRPVNENDIANEIFRLDPQKAMGQDCIHSRLIIDAAYHISRPLAHIANSTITQAIFPDALKVVKIIPLYKKGSALDVSDYRPISISPVLSKIIESIINKQLMSFLDKYNILLPSQYGFRKIFNTKLALADLVFDIVDKMDEGFVTF
uniref:RNA-directed DNA polymerase from mobile element jockey-like n=1 Tax=Saccoglossus kowalevskii TaxID=10224 RepID=A0ABM0MJI7_SACKO